MSRMDSISVKVTGNSMWPTLSEGDIIDFIVDNENYQEGQIVLAKHPLIRDLLIIKRIFSISEKGVFLQGDNPDPTATDDSHNFGHISKENIIGIENI